jgi:hypothetical protein
MFVFSRPSEQYHCETFNPLTFLVIAGTCSCNNVKLFMHQKEFWDNVVCSPFPEPPAPQSADNFEQSVPLSLLARIRTTYKKGRGKSCL